MKIVTYHSDEVDTPSLKWVSYIQSGGIFLGIRFNAETKGEAKKKAKFWLDNQTKPKAMQVDTTEEEFAKYKAEKEDSVESYQEPDEDSEEPVIKPARMLRHVSQGPGRGHGNVGKIWVVNRSSGVRKRVAADELQDYLKQGFKQGKKL